MVVVVVETMICRLSPVVEGEGVVVGFVGMVVVVSMKWGL